MVVAVLVERWACDDRPDPLIIGMTVSVRLPISPKSVNEGVKTGCDQDREVRGPAYSVSIAKVTRAARQ
ncbi:MAG: hypothetical protein EB145_02560 [Proteobacteria bacterium]|nr:hypothetical protein [Pseudomonadota bacterium]